MTEISETAKQQIHWVRFSVALVIAPLLITAAALPFSLIPALSFVGLIPYFALILGGPIYLIFGVPILIWHLRRHPPKVGPIVLLAVISLAGLIPIGLVCWAIIGGNTVMPVLFGYLIYGAVFAAIWSATFALIYQRMIRNL